MRIAVYGTILTVLVTLADSAILNSSHGGGLSPESATIASLRHFISAQWAFRKEDRYTKGRRVYANSIDGKGFPDLYRIDGPLPENAPSDGTELKLIDLAFARATSPKTARAGYWFVNIVGDAVSGKHYDYTQDCGLCAVPAKYKVTGFNTYIVDLRGTVYHKDNGGKPVTVFPDVEKDGWRALSN
jgi:hypothetical protein